MKKTSTFSIALKVTGIHLGVIGVVVLYSLLNGCFKPVPKNEVVMFVELASMGPAMGGGAEPTPPEEVEEQEVEEEPEEIDEPTPPDDPIPEPPEDPMPEPEESRPDWEPTPVSDINVSNQRVDATPARSQNPVAEIDPGKILESGSPSGPVGTPSEFATYDKRLRAIFTQAWESYKPSSGGPARIQISFRADGTITSCRLLQGSGDAEYDNAALRAAKSVPRLPRPPSGYGTSFNMTFSLTN
ncbi:MAG: TonB C-terminal domain-containing protein [Pontiellaceae bacterium]|nr:TonB C-terminal domain-containing protein [Pontiellaceae bacterium]